MRVTPSTYIVGIILFTFFILGGVAMINEFQNKDSTFVDTTKYAQFNATFNRMNDVQTQVKGLEGGITTSENDFGALGVLNSLISTGWNTLRLLISSFGFMNVVYDGLTTFFGVPAWIPMIIISLVSIMFVFAIFSAVFQREI